MTQVNQNMTHAKSPKPSFLPERIPLLPMRMALDQLVQEKGIDIVSRAGRGAMPKFYKGYGTFGQQIYIRCQTDYSKEESRPPKDEIMRGGKSRGKRFSLVVPDVSYVSGYMDRYENGKLTGQVKRFMDYARWVLVPTYLSMYDPVTGHRIVEQRLQPKK